MNVYQRYRASIADAYLASSWPAQALPAASWLLPIEMLSPSQKSFLGLEHICKSHFPSLSTDSITITLSVPHHWDPKLMLRIYRFIGPRSTCFHNRSQRQDAKGSLS